MVYGATTLVSLMLLLRPAPDSSWGITAILSLAIVAWITVVNFLYLLLQMAIGADNCGVMEAVQRIARLFRLRFRVVAEIFGATLVLIVLTTAASILATVALGLIGFVPFVGLAALPLQLIAWVVRGLVFEFIGLTSLVAYLRVYRESYGSHEVHLHRRAAV
jgi:hypothetical protein